MRTYLSRRGIPLVYAGDPARVPVLTVENYSKWYGLCLVMPDGSVLEVSFGELQDLADAARVSPFVDHVPNATLVPALAEVRGWSLDSCSYEMMVGRWECEVVNSRKYDY